MSRQERRAAVRQVKRLVDALSRGQGADQSQPLVMQGGYVHTVCGNPAEMASHYRLANCPTCGGTVPVAEVRRGG